MTTIQINEVVANSITTIVDAGKTPWVIINNDYVVGVYAGRDAARSAKATEKLEGKIVKADEIEFEVISFAAQVQALHDADKAPAIEEPAPKEKAPKSPKVEITHESTVERPCKKVFHIAGEMAAANPGVKRKEVLAECVKQGVAYYTARTQYQQWLTVRKEEMAREAAQAKK